MDYPKNKVFIELLLSNKVKTKTTLKFFLLAMSSMFSTYALITLLIFIAIVCTMIILEKLRSIIIKSDNKSD